VRLDHEVARVELLVHRALLAVLEVGDLLERDEHLRHEVGDAGGLEPRHRVARDAVLAARLASNEVPAHRRYPLPPVRSIVVQRPSTKSAPARNAIRKRTHAMTTSDEFTASGTVGHVTLRSSLSVSLRR